MLFAVSVSGNLDQLRKRWQLEAMKMALGYMQERQGNPHPEFNAPPMAVQGPRVPLFWRKEGFQVLEAEDDLRPAFSHDTSSYQGLVAVVDWSTGAILWRHAWGSRLPTPAGFCFGEQSMYLADMEGNSIFEVDLLHEPGRLLRRITHSALNDVHSLVRTRRGLLIASSGTDAVIELDLKGNTLYEWWAGEHGFTATPGGVERLAQPGAEHRATYYHTPYQATHLNVARYRDEEETKLLVLLFHQGTLVEIDTTQPSSRQEPRTVVEGLAHPHALRRLPDGGWSIANSEGREIVVLDRDLNIVRRIPSVGGWIQDALSLGDGRWLVADVNDQRLVEHDERGAIRRELAYGESWRVYAVEPLPPAFAASFLTLNGMVTSAG